MKSLWLLLAIACTSLVAEEVSLSVPRFPPVELPDATDPLHGRFQEAWRKYWECERRVENSVIQFLDKEFNKAADRGSLDAADMWNQKKKVFIETGRVAVEVPSKPKASARKTQKTDQAENIGEYLESAQQEINEAKKGLRTDYESLVREYTKARNLERAKQVREQAMAFGITQDEPAGRPKEGDKKPETKAIVPRNGIELQRFLAGTAWKNQNGFTFEWDLAGNLWHCRDGGRTPVKIAYTGGNQCAVEYVNKAKQILVFNEQFTEFKQIGADGKSQQTALRLR